MPKFGEVAWLASCLIRVPPRRPQTWYYDVDAGCYVEWCYYARRWIARKGQNDA